MPIKSSQFQYTVGYGIGQYYDYIKSQLSSEIQLDFMCDAKWEQIGVEYDGIKVISPETLKNMESVFVVVFSGNVRNWKSITAMLDDMGLPYVHANKMLSVQSAITGRELKNREEGVNIDAWGNRIEFFPDVEDSTINFVGSGSRRMKQW